LLLLHIPIPRQYLIRFFWKGCHMSSLLPLLSVLAAVDVSIMEPADGGIYNGDWLTLKAIVENENVLPDSVVFSLNGEPFTPVPRLITDWPTYMQSNVHNGFSESPAPMTNEVLWTAPVTGPLHEFPNPTVVDGVVYYPSNTGDRLLHAMEAATGEEIWSYPIVGADDPPSYSEGRLYVASDSIYCIDALTGERIWTFPDAEYNGGTPCVMDGRVACGRGVMSSDLTYLFCLSADDGQVLWSRELEGCIANCIAGWGGMYFVGTFGEGGQLCALDAETGETIWSNPIVVDGYWDTSPTIVNGKIYIGGMDGSVHRFDALTGTLEWSTPLGDGIEPTPAVYMTTIICGNVGDGVAPGCLAALEMSDGSLVWSIPTSIHGSPAVADGVVFWGGFSEPYDNMYAADASSGEIIWEYDPNPGSMGLQSTPAITDGVMYYASTDYNLYAFGNG